MDGCPDAYAFAASRITAATSCGFDSITTWLAASDVTCAFMRFAICSSAAGGIIRSFAACTYYARLVFHAALEGLPSNAAIAVQPCFAARSL